VLGDNLDSLSLYIYVVTTCRLDLAFAARVLCTLHSKSIEYILTLMTS
jgi:hypothetical protein